MSHEDHSREELEEAIEALEQRVDEIEDERDTWEERAKTFKADLENYRDKQDERRERWKHEARRDLASDLIGVLDNLERAIMSADEDSGLLQGVRLVADQLYEALQRRGLERIEAEGEEFDPRLHSAVDTRHHPKHNRVIEQKRTGYMYNDQVLREAEVIVGQNEDDG